MNKKASSQMKELLEQKLYQKIIAQTRKFGYKILKIQPSNKITAETIKEKIEEFLKYLGEEASSPYFLRPIYSSWARRLFSLLYNFRLVD